MPSPFPGMDPFIESQKWEGFHLAAIAVICELLAKQVADRYVVNIEERVYLEDPYGDEVTIIPDVDIIRAGGERLESETEASPATTIHPVSCLLPEPESHREGFLEIRTADGDRLVTVIELLSPTNKNPDWEGRRQYLRKRTDLLQTEVNLVELDLLRGGRRLPMRSPYPSGDYFALVSRAWERPRCEVYGWMLSDHMPSVPIPLAETDAEPRLDLQSVLNLVYDRGVYRLSLKYAHRVRPPFSDDEERWAKGLLEQTNSRA